MSFLDRLWWRPAPVSDAAGLADFVDAHAAFVAQKGIYEYSRARAGHYAKVLFSEPDFQRAVDIVKTNPKILLTECDHGDKQLEEFVYCAIAETIIQELHKEFEPRAWAVFEEAQARLSASPGSSRLSPLVSPST